MNKFLFVRLDHNWADEFDVKCGYVTTAAEYDADIARIKSLFDSGDINGKEFYFGTNEALQFDSFEDFMNGVTADECSKEFYDEFNKLNSNGSIGFCVMDNMYV